MIPIEKILVPIDFSDTSRYALDLARTLADGAHASLHLMHVICYPLDAAGAPEQRRKECERLEALLDRTDRESRRATTSCEIGTPVNEIVRFATEHDIDLIVMGTHTHGPAFQMARASIAANVVGLAPCAVLAVKPTERGRAAGLR